MEIHGKAGIIYFFTYHIILWYNYSIGGAGRTTAESAEEGSPMTDRLRVVQGRIRAANADEAAVKLRDRYGSGRLTLKPVDTGWYEYTAVAAKEAVRSVSSRVHSLHLTWTL